MRTEVAKFTSQECLDLRGVPCPQNVSQLLLRLASMDTGRVLEVSLDRGEPYDNVMESLSFEGLEVEDMSDTGAGYHRIKVIAR
jgi:TusA-related sulfurtransferase